VKQTQQGRTARIPLLIGTNKDEGSVIVVGDPTAYQPTIDAFVSAPAFHPAMPVYLCPAQEKQHSQLPARGHRHAQEAVPRAVRGVPDRIQRLRRHLACAFYLLPPFCMHS
jgi:hypothetical protein